ncbi:hypothetical protein H0R94_10670 [Treponema socranskii]|uniref:hypothetical protein n=1 Tax=Treponema socranskii TaxID=53419 RepID=UPI003D8A8E81
MKSSVPLFALSGFLLFFSCSLSAPDVKGVKAAAVFEYADNDSDPRMRLAVFAEAGSDVRRVESIRIVSNDRGWEWKAIGLEIFASDARQWAGYTNFVSPGDGAIPQGAYTFFYTDALGDDAESSFSVFYPADLVHTRSGEAKEKLGTGMRERIALYDEKDVLIYFDTRKAGWREDDDVWREMENASRMRLCFLNADASVLCFMPFIDRPEISPTSGE